ncbi:hypothetical protein ANANG_G00297350 [Anguilla anguilla]|uniref:Conserved oligomeric Golgi complex subunit 1 n=1 Tax=Anguilla anguilla TaxID=7936 RepID=A0A9D3LQX2_ANGAN|nr:hypothetical protein ANANG_G00297350 [Anguilla anguilla]
MAVVPAQSLRVSEIRDPAALFERYNTEEIRTIERKVRGEIEEKKEELRQMVGERYRDLIDAADTIGEMRQSSESVVLSIQDMYRYCHKLKQGKTPAPANNKQETQRQSQEKFYSMASQIKLLLEVPERIWSAMEASQYLRATQLYLLCSHLHGLLGLEGGAAHYSPVLARFPVLVRQVAAAGHFRATILLDSRSLLRGRAVSDQAITEALVSTMLLEDSSPRQALADFLLARKASIQQLLNQPQHGAGIKAQVCSLVELLVTTLYQAYAVFYTPREGTPSDPGLSCGLLFTTLESVTSTTSAGKGQKVLQEEPIQGEQLRDTLQQWIHTCKEDVRSGVSGLLVYVKSLKGLAAIRDAVWDLLSSESISQHWATVCQRLLERPLPLWDDFLQQLFLQRLQALTREGTEGVSSGSRQLLTSTLRELEAQSSRAALFERDVASFLWAESPGDLASDAAWVGVSQRGPGAERAGHEDAGAHALRADGLRSAGRQAEGAAGRPAALPALRAPPRGRSLRLRPLHGRGRGGGHAAGTLPGLRARRALLRARRAGRRPGDALGPRPPAQLSSALFLARLCQSVAELCPNLKQCILGKQAGADPVGRATPRQGKKLGKSVSKATEVSPAQAQWAELKEELQSCSMEAYRIWSSALSQELVRSFTDGLHADSPGSVLATATNWEELEIQEEAESGSSVTSKIRLPVQPSWYVQSLLFHLCLEVNRVGGHALPKVTLQELLRGCLDLVVSEYEKLTQHPQSKDGSFPVTQSRALQLLFDLFPLQHPDNLNRLSQRTSVLLGLLTGPEKQFSSRGNSVGSQEPYNILPLASSQIRFGLLPLSMSQSRKAKAATLGVDVTRPLVPPASAPPTEATFRPGSLFRQLTNQEEDSVTPSLFKLGWLSGMTK